MGKEERESLLRECLEDWKMQGEEEGSVCRHVSYPIFCSF